MKSTGQAKLGREIYLAVGLAACGSLLLEISLTRVLSVLLRFHFVFLIISSALCGLGLGGMLGLSRWRVLTRRFSDRHILVALALAAAASVPLAMFILFRTPLIQHVFDPLTVPLVAMGPFLLTGAFLSYAFDRAVAQAGGLYFADLFGAATGSLGVIIVLNSLGGINAVVASAVLFAAAAAALSFPGFRMGWVASAACVIALIGLLVANRGEGVIGLQAVRYERDNMAAYTNVKPLFSPTELGDESLGSEIVATDWNAFARTDVVRNEGDSTLYVYTDGDVPTNMLAYDGTAESVIDTLSVLGFAGIVAGPRERVLFIGPGGGLDIHLGILAGADDMVGVELNPSIPRLMHSFRDHNGSVYGTEGYSLYVDEGRSFVRRDPRQYDVIYTALTKTATTATSGLALVESHVFTEEGFRDYLGHLTPQGRLVAVFDQEIIARRALVTALRALETSGVPLSKALDHVALVAIPRAAKTLGVVARVGERHGVPVEETIAAGRGIALDPSLWWASPYSHMLIVTKSPIDERSSRLLEHVFARPWLTDRDYGRMELATDPFLHSITGLLVGPNARMQATEEELAWIRDTRAAEIEGLEILYLPHVAEGHAGIGAIAQSEGGLQAYVDSEPRWNLAPVSDDKPFFVDIAKGPNRALASLTVIPIVAAAAGAVICVASIGMRWRREGAGLPLAHGISFGYFGLLGLGFMLIEVPLAQKLVLFLGYPTLSLSVVVFGLLVGGGMGSLMSQSWEGRRLVHGVRIAGLAVVVMGLLHALVVPGMLDALLGIPVFWRAALALALVVPMGVALGVPFPSGLRLSARLLPGLTPRAWGVNGLLSTAGSVLAMLGARELGFTQTMLVGCGLYLLVVLLAPLVGRGRPTGTETDPATEQPGLSSPAVGFGGRD